MLQCNDCNQLYPSNEINADGKCATCAGKERGKTMELTEYQKDSRRLLEVQANLRKIIYNENLPQEERDAARAELKNEIDAHVKKFPIITGTFEYTQEDVEDAKEAGYYE
jgi:NAD-dependent SIR2 family protein deacetylase